MKVLMPILADHLAPMKKYVFEDNELDVKCRELEKSFKDMSYKITAAVDMVKNYAEEIDKLMEDVKTVKKNINTFTDKIKQVEKIAHPPAIPLNEINEFKNSVKDVRWMMKIFNKMKNITLLKSIFK